MQTQILTFLKKEPKAWATIGLILLVTMFMLQQQGRLWICDCGQVYMWVGDIWSSDNSQHIFDPYSFSHVLHGVMSWAILMWLLPRLSLSWQLVITTFVEASWEVAENSAMIINRYRESTLALGYNGDTILNSIADIFCCIVGFAIALRLGYRRSLALFIVTELVMILWIKDSFLLNVLMLIYPIQAIKMWQMGQ